MFSTFIFHTRNDSLRHDIRLYVNLSDSWSSFILLPINDGKCVCEIWISSLLACIDIHAIAYEKIIRSKTTQKHVHRQFRLIYFWYEILFISESCWNDIRIIFLYYSHIRMIWFSNDTYDMIFIRCPFYHLISAQSYKNNIKIICGEIPCVVSHKNRDWGICGCLREKVSNFNI